MLILILFLLKMPSRKIVLLIPLSGFFEALFLLSASFSWWDKSSLVISNFNGIFELTAENWVLPKLMHAHWLIHNILIVFKWRLTMRIGIKINISLDNWLLLLQLLDMRGCCIVMWSFERFRFTLRNTLLWSEFNFILIIWNTLVLVKSTRYHWWSGN